MAANAAINGGSSATYAYDGRGLRVKKVVGANTTVYVFSGGKVIAEYANGTLSVKYVYAGSRLLATLYPSTTTPVVYHYPDLLSTRLETTPTGVVVRSFGHLPFGETWYETGVSDKQKFTSYERDAESGNDYAMFRYDSSRLGRFMTPDPLVGSVSSPQSLNRYAYVTNDPVNLIDPLGLSACWGYYVYVSHDGGNTWEYVGFICIHPILDQTFDPVGNEEAKNCGNDSGSSAMAPQTNACKKPPQTKQQKCQQAKDALSKLNQQDKALNKAYWSGLAKEEKYAIPAGCLWGMATGEVVETPVEGTGMAPGNCAVGAVGTGLATYSIYTAASFDVVIAGLKATGQAAVLLGTDCRELRLNQFCFLEDRRSD